MSGVTFDFDELFDPGYLYFYESRLAQASDADTALIWRVGWRR